VAWASWSLRANHFLTQVLFGCFAPLLSSRERTQQPPTQPTQRVDAMRSQRWGSRAALYGMHKHCEHTACSPRHHHLNALHTAANRAAHQRRRVLPPSLVFGCVQRCVVCMCVPRTWAVMRGRCLLASWQSVTHLCRVGRLAPDPALCGGLHSQRFQLCVRSLCVCRWLSFAQFSRNSKIWREPR
jgi:hypothetical protein